jgi:hypothetical protein
MFEIRKRLATAGFLVLTLLPAAYAQAPASAAGVPDITGSWERARDASIPPAAQPALKPQYQKEQQAKNQAARDASAKGTPLADRLQCVCPKVCLQ